MSSFGNYVAGQTPTSKVKNFREEPLKNEDLPPPTLMYLVVNPASGGTEGQNLILLEDRDVIFDDDDDINVELRVFDIRDINDGQKDKFLEIKEVTESGQFDEDHPLRVIVAGGDGTVLWCISELDAHGVDCALVAIGILALGTGNDFSQATGFGNSKGNVLVNLREHIRRYLSADVIPYDVWDIEVDVDPDGSILRVIDKEKFLITNPDGSNITQMNKKAINYFSTGLESRIGLGFDKHRTKSVIANKLTYAKETIKKTFISTPTIKDYIECIYVGEDGSKVISSQDLSGDPVSLLFVNNNSFASGSDVWGNATKTADLGLSEEEQVELRAKFQSFSDEQIEILTAASVFDFIKMKLGLSPMQRLFQGKGPFGIAFKQTEVKTYMQVDGEYFQLYRPREARIRFDGQVRVLVRNESVQSCCSFGPKMIPTSYGTGSQTAMHSESARFSDRKFPADAEHHDYFNHGTKSKRVSEEKNTEMTDYESQIFRSYDGDGEEKFNSQNMKDEGTELGSIVVDCETDPNVVENS
jgi:diacylglycerol kinase (ATP)